ncbi:hypothetical protein GCM10028820_20730 [Tessaracoccus terricola]
MTDDQFSKAFKQIVPDSPSPEGWASGALRKRRNRAGIVGGTVGVLAVALAIPLAVSLSGTQLMANPEQDAAENGAPNPAEHAPEDSDGGSQPDPGLPGAAACFDEDGERVQPTTDDVELEPGAVRAWLCGDATVSNPFGTIGPLEPLEQGVDQVVEFVEAQPELDLATITCTMEYSLSYLVVLEYPDGSLAHVTAETHGCQAIMVGQTAHSGGVEFLGHLTGLWSAQRDSVSEPEPVGTTPACPVPNTMLVPSLEDIVSGVVCVGDPETGQYGRSLLAPEDVERVVADIRANAVEGEASGWDATLALVGSWGDWLRLVASEDGSSYWFVDAEGTSRVWTPSPEVAELLAVAADHPDMPSQPGTKDPEMPVNPDPTQVIFEPDGCVGVQAGELITSELPDGVVPADPTAVWLCGKGLDQATGPAGPLEPLEGGAAQSAVDLYNALEVPDPDRACTEELGPSYFVVHQYADGTRLPVEIQDYGCRVVAAGADLRGGGVDYLDALVGLWNEQREATGTPTERPAPICSLTSAIIPVDAAAGFSDAFACTNIFDDGQGGERGEERLSPELLQALSEMLATSSFPLPADTPYVVPTNDAVVALNQYGDPLALSRMEDGTYEWRDGDRWMVWEPPSAVAVELDELLAR